MITNVDYHDTNSGWYFLDFNSLSRLSLLKFNWYTWHKKLINCVLLLPNVTSEGSYVSPRMIMLITIHYERRILNHHYLSMYFHTLWRRKFWIANDMISHFDSLTTILFNYQSAIPRLMIADVSYHFILLTKWRMIPKSFDTDPAFQFLLRSLVLRPERDLI